MGSYRQHRPGFGKRRSLVQREGVIAVPALRSAGGLLVAVAVCAMLDA
jgi:hypothetical protein